MGLSSLSLFLLGEQSLDLLNRLGQQSLLELWVANLGLDLGDDGSGQLLLLHLSDLGLVSDPGVKDGLGLVGDFNLLLELECLGLKSSGLLRDLEKSLGGGNNVLELRNLVDSLLDGINVLGSGRVKNIGDVLDGARSPVVVQRSNHFDHQQDETGEGGEQDGLVVNDVELVGNGVDGTGSGSRQDTGLGQWRVAWQRVNE